MTNRIKIVTAAAMILAGISGFLSSCYYDNKEELYGIITCDTSAVTYEEHILPILNDQCMLCHSTAAAPVVGGDNDLEGYDNLMGYVVAGDPENSLFYASVAWLEGAIQMPRPNGSSQLDDCELALIRNWIIQGANN